MKSYCTASGQPKRLRWCMPMSCTTEAAPRPRGNSMDNSIKSSPVPRGAGHNLSRPFQTCGTGFLLYQIFIAFTRSGLWPPRTPSPIRADQIHVITVARLSKEKGIERALDAVRACVDAGIPIQYHIVGDGAGRQALQKRAAQLGLAGRVTFYGMQQNPYRFMKQADLFLLPSYHEAAPLVFTEAKCLGRAHPRHKDGLRAGDDPRRSGGMGLREHHSGDRP